jgi:type II secretory pathway component PulF
VELANSLHSPAAIEQWTAVNQEILALARAGLPMESGLRAAAADMLAKDGAKTTQVADALAAGSDLATALEKSGVVTPPAYVAALRAGERTGKLATAIEGIINASATAQLAARQWRLAIWHPWFILVIGLACIAATRSFTAEPLAKTLRELDVPSTFLETWLAWWPWSIDPTFLISLVLVIPIVAWLALRAIPWFIGRGVGWSPLSRARLQQAQAFQSDLLALLLEHEVPLPEALALSGDASGHLALAAASEREAQRLTRGGVEANEPSRASTSASPFSLGVSWVTRASRISAESLRLLRNDAQRLRRKANDSIVFWLTIVPVTSGFLCAGLLALIQAGLTVGPFFEALHRMALK